MRPKSPRDEQNVFCPEIRRLVLIENEVLNFGWIPRRILRKFENAILDVVHAVESRLEGVTIDVSHLNIELF